MRSMEINESELRQLISARASASRFMSLDLGSRTIGIAFSDSRLKIATARETLKRRKFTEDCKVIIDLADKENVFAIVLGMPYNMDGSEGPRAQSTRSFVRNFSRLSELPIFLQDERLSSWAAEQAMLEADLSRKKREEKIDAVAAAIILQGLLDRLDLE